MQDTARRCAVHVVAAAAVACSVATSSPGPDLGIPSDELGPDELVLPMWGDAVTRAVRATLLLDERVDGITDGTIAAVVDSAGDDAQVTLSIVSETSGAEQSVVIDLAVQETTSLGVDAFTGCTPDVECVDDVVIELALAEPLPDADVTVLLTVQASADPATEVEGDATTVQLQER